jgi:hypothetical protein
MHGSARKGLELSTEDIRTRFPGLDADLAEAVRHMLRQAVVQTLGLREAGSWGVAAQERHAGLVEQALQLGQDPQWMAAQHHLARLHDLLDELAQALQHQLHPGLLTRLRPSLPEVVGARQDEIALIRKALAGSADSLQAQSEALTALHGVLANVRREVSAGSIAASLLADALSSSQGAERTALHARALLLTQSSAHMDGTQTLLGCALQERQSLLVAIQAAVLVQLPAWLASVQSVSRETQNPTWLRTRRQELDALAHALHGHQSP